MSQLLASTHAAWNAHLSFRPHILTSSSNSDSTFKTKVKHHLLKNTFSVSRASGKCLSSRLALHSGYFYHILTINAISIHYVTLPNSSTTSVFISFPKCFHSHYFFQMSYESVTKVILDANMNRHRTDCIVWLFATFNIVQLSKIFNEFLNEVYHICIA